MTSRVRIGTFLLLLPLHNAVRVGEDAATVDIISNGRFDMGFGQGYSPSEFEGYGIPRKQRASLLEEGIEVIRGMVDPRSILVRRQALPSQEHQLSSQTGADSPSPRCGSEQDNQKPSNGQPGWAVTSWAQMTPLPRETYDTALRAHGRSPKDFHAAQLRWAHVAPTPRRSLGQCPGASALYVNLVRPLAGPRPSTLPVPRDLRSSHQQQNCVM